MTIVLSASVVVLAALVFLLLGAQVEMHRDLAQVRELTGLIDRPTSLDVAGAVGRPPSAVGLPAELDEVPAALVLFLSDKCSTCRSIAGSLDGGVPPGLWLVLDPADPHREPELGLNYRLDPTKVTIDRDRQISVQLGVTVTPAGVVVQRGRIASATTVPSTRRLYELLDSDVTAGPASATGVARPVPAPTTAKITQRERT